MQIIRNTQFRSRRRASGKSAAMPASASSSDWSRRHAGDVAACRRRRAAAEGLSGNRHPPLHARSARTVPDNGDQNPYAVVVAPVSAGKIQKGDVLVDNFNDHNNLQGLGTHDRRLHARRRRTLATVRQHPAPPAAMPRRHRPDHRDDHAEIRLGHRRQPAEPGRHDRDQGPGLPAGARRQDGHVAGTIAGAGHQRAVGQHGGDRQRRRRRTLFVSNTGFGVGAPGQDVVNKATVLRLDAVDPARQAAGGDRARR